MSWHRLAFSSKPMGAFESPHRQRVLPLALAPASLWRGQVAESKRQRAPGGRKGGSRPAPPRLLLAIEDQQVDECAEVVDSDASVGSLENDERED